MNGMSLAGHVEYMDNVNVCRTRVAAPEGRNPFGFGEDARAVLL